MQPVEAIEAGGGKSDLVLGLSEQQRKNEDFRYVAIFVSDKNERTKI